MLAKDFILRIPKDHHMVSSLNKEINKESLKEIIRLINEAEAIVVGAGSGMSSDCGYDFYHDNKFFQHYFSEEKEKYGFNNLFAGLYHVFSTPEEHWAFMSKSIQVLYDLEPGIAYIDLYNILKEKEYFILTTNIDMQFGKTFPQENVWFFQGDEQYFQCSQPCHDRIYKNRETVENLVKNTHNYKVPSELIPRCPECGRIMVSWVRDKEFLEGQHWSVQKERYENFLVRHQHKKVVFLELGVGDMTPSIIKYPFWDMTKNWKDARLISINAGKITAPEQIKDKTVLLTMDIRKTLNIIRNSM